MQGITSCNFDIAVPVCYDVIWTRSALKVVIDSRGLRGANFDLSLSVGEETWSLKSFINSRFFLSFNVSVPINSKLQNPIVIISGVSGGEGSGAAGAGSRRKWAEKGHTMDIFCPQQVLNYWDEHNEIQ